MAGSTRQDFGVTGLRAVPMGTASFNPGAGGSGPYEYSLGDELRGERATLGKTLLDIQRDLRIKAAYIAAIEDAKPDVFPNPSFIAGYVLSLIHI